MNLRMTESVVEEVLQRDKTANLQTLYLMVSIDNSEYFKFICNQVSL